jgi:acyl carrier protein
MPTKDEIYEKIKVALVEALGVDEDEVQPKATLVGDLGAESIDFLDIVFRRRPSRSRSPAENSSPRTS